jgi:hypothetical protein
MFLLFGLFVTGIQNPALRSSQPIPSALNLYSKDKWCLQKCHFFLIFIDAVPFRYHEVAMLIACS